MSAGSLRSGWLVWSGWCDGFEFVPRWMSRAAPCLAAAVLSVASPAWAQSSRTEAIAAEQADKATDLQPRVPPGAERAVKWVKDELIDEPSGLYPYFGSVYSGGGFTLGAGYRRYYGDNTHWDVKVLYSIKNYKLIELSTDSWNHAGGSSTCTPAPAGATRRRSPSTASGSTARDDGRLRRHAGLRGRRGRLAAAGQRPPAGRRDRTRTTRGAARAPAVDPVDLRRGHRARARARARLLHTRRPRRHRLAAGGRLRAARRALRSRATTTTPTGRHLQLRSPRRRGRAAHPDPARELGDLAARPAADDARRRRSGAVLPAAVARQRQHAARLQQLALPRSARHADVAASGAGSPAGWRSTWRCSTTPAWSRRARRAQRSDAFVSDSASACGFTARRARRCASSWRSGREGHAARLRRRARRSDHVRDMPVDDRRCLALCGVACVAPSAPAAGARSRPRSSTTIRSRASRRRRTPSKVAANGTSI